VHCERAFRDRRSAAPCAIVNRTGLDGEYDFELELTPDDTRPSPIDPAFLLSALRDQLGLSVKSEKVPFDILVIDSAEKVAAGN